MLVGFEPLTAERVRLFLRLRQFESALSAAVDSHECARVSCCCLCPLRVNVCPFRCVPAELVYTVVIQLLHQLAASHEDELAASSEAAGTAPAVSI